MLTNEELGVLLDKEKLTLEDLLLMEHHLLSISDIFDENSDTIDHDVSANLSRDIDLIIARLQKERKKIANSYLKIVK